MKPLPLWSLSKTPETSAYALSPPSRTTLLLVAKESNGRIFHNPREKEDSLSLKMKNKTSCIFPFFLPTFSSWLCFILFLFAFLSFFISFLLSFPFHFLISFLSSFLFLFHFLLIFSFLFSLLSSFLEHIPHPVKGGNFLPFSSNQICGSQFSILKSLFLYFLYDIIHSSGSL